MAEIVAYKVSFKKLANAKDPQEIEDGLLCQLPIPFHFYDQRDNYLFVHLLEGQTNILKEVRTGLKKRGYMPTRTVKVLEY